MNDPSWMRRQGNVSLLDMVKDEFGYKFYDLVENKLVRNHDVHFIEDQTIGKIDKVEKSTP